MQNENIQSVNSPQTRNEPIEQEQVDKERKIAKQKKVFLTLSYTFGSVFLAVILLSFGLGIYNRYFAPKTPIVVNPKQEEPKEENKNLPIEKISLYKSDNLKLTLEYPKEARLIDTWESQDQTKKLEIFFSKDANYINGTESITDSNITEGYIFRVSTFTTNIRNLDEIAKVKKESVVAGCPETAEFSETYETTLNGVESRAFEARNCEGDFTITYSPKIGVYYAFEQIYKGDIGYKQKQKAATQEIMDSVRFYPDSTGPESDMQTFTNDSPKFTFDHPKFDSGCCEVQGPPSDNNMTKLVTLADKETYVDKSNFDGFTVFNLNLGTNYGNNYESFLERQKKMLIDDYIVVKGVEPKLQEVSLKIGEKDATLLRGYSWRENDLIYVDVPTDRGHHALIIAVKNMTGEGFEEKLDIILSSFKFL